MKIRASNPLHWLWLGLSLLTVVLARLLRAAGLRRDHRAVVLLYGHKLHGNLLALYEYHRSLADEPTFDLCFLTLDPAYFRALAARGVRVRPLFSPACIGDLLRCRVIVSDHGLHALQFLQGSPDLAFVDVWHGIPFKGFDAEDFRVQHRYDEVWVPSPLMRQLYERRFGFRAGQLHVTGYARTDWLVRGETDVPREAVLPDRVPRSQPLVLIAPTWKQDDPGRSVLPFGMSAAGFLALLEELAAETGCHFLLRMHLNADAFRTAGGRGFSAVPAADYPDTERLLLHCDALVTDWSSIAFDYLLLMRPVLFLDVPPPFRKGFSLGPEYRYAAVAPDAAAMAQALKHMVLHPDRYMDAHRARYREVAGAVYGDFADGQASRRCHERLRRLLN